jgi:hypothetical protein
MASRTLGSVRFEPAGLVSVLQHRRDTLKHVVRYRLPRPWNGSGALTTSPRWAHRSYKAPIHESEQALEAPGR